MYQSLCDWIQVPCIDNCYTANYPILGNIKNIIEPTNENKFFISKIGCQEILRRAKERGIKVNVKLEKALQRTSIIMDIEN